MFIVGPGRQLSRLTGPFGYSASLFVVLTAFYTVIPGHFPARTHLADNLRHLRPTAVPARPALDHHGRHVHGLVDGWKAVRAMKWVVLKSGTVLDGQFMGHMGWINKAIVCEQPAVGFTVTDDLDYPAREEGMPVRICLTGDRVMKNVTPGQHDPIGTNQRVLNTHFSVE